MTVQYSEEILNRFVAPNIYSFAQAQIPDLHGLHDQSSHWLSNHFLNAIFAGTFTPPSRQFAINALYRVQIAFDYYHQGRDLTTEYLARSTLGHPIVSLYFRALAKWEVCFQNLAILVDLIYRWNDQSARVFEPGDASPMQRAYDINNKIKHFGRDLRAETIGADLTVPMWLENDGFHTTEHVLKYDELAGLMDDAATLADQLQHPASFMETTE